MMLVNPNPWYERGNIKLTVFGSLIPGLNESRLYILSKLSLIFTLLIR